MKQPTEVARAVYPFKEQRPFDLPNKSLNGYRLPPLILIIQCFLFTPAYPSRSFSRSLVYYPGSSFLLFASKRPCCNSGLAACLLGRCLCSKYLRDLPIRRRLNLRRKRCRYRGGFVSKEFKVGHVQSFRRSGASGLLSSVNVSTSDSSGEGSNQHNKPCS